MLLGSPAQPSVLTAEQLPKAVCFELRAAFLWLVFWLPGSGIPQGHSALVEGCKNLIPKTRKLRLGDLQSIRCGGCFQRSWLLAARAPSKEAEAKQQTFPQEDTEKMPSDHGVLPRRLLFALYGVGTSTINLQSMARTASPRH